MMNQTWAELDGSDNDVIEVPSGHLPVLRKAMLNAWLRIILCRRLRDGDPCLKDQLEDLKHVGKTTFWKI